MTHLEKGEGAALLDRFRDYLRDHRQPVTRQREQIARVLLESEEHLSIEEIRDRLVRAGESPGLATIYRTVDLLVESGLVRSRDFGQGYRRFEPVPAPGDHHHLVCSRCGRVAEFTHERLERMLPMIADEHGFQLERHRLEIYGTCRDCRRRVGVRA
jgi:Fur family ferric uptake transcriptional regulator